MNTFKQWLDRKDEQLKVEEDTLESKLTFLRYSSNNSINTEAIMDRLIANGMECEQAYIKANT